MLSGNQNPVPTAALSSMASFAPRFPNFCLDYPVGGRIMVICMVCASMSSVLKSLLLNGPVILGQIT